MSKATFPLLACLALPMPLDMGAYKNEDFSNKLRGEPPKAGSNEKAARCRLSFGFGSGLVFLDDFIREAGDQGDIGEAIDQVDPKFG